MITMNVYPETQSQIEGGKLIAQSLESSWCSAPDGKVTRMSCVPSKCCSAGNALTGGSTSLLPPTPLSSGDRLQPLGWKADLYWSSCAHFPWLLQKNTTGWGPCLTEIYFFTIMEAKSPLSSRCWQVWVLLSPPSLARRWLPCCCAHPLSVLCLNLLFF